MRPDEDRSFAGPEIIDPDNEAEVGALAERLAATPEAVVDAVQAVGPNVKAVELWLTLPPA